MFIGGSLLKILPKSGSPLFLFLAPAYVSMLKVYEFCQLFFVIAYSEVEDTCTNAII